MRTENDKEKSIFDEEIEEKQKEKKRKRRKEKIKEFWILFISVFLVSSLTFGVGTAGIAIVEQIWGNIAQEKIKKDEHYSFIELNIYAADDVVLNGQIENIKDVYDKLPSELKEYMLREWVVVIETEKEGNLGQKEDRFAIGTTYSSKRIIRILPKFTAGNFAHECGHVFDYFLASVSKTEKFEEMYKEDWLRFGNYGHEANVFSIENSCEFFASLFAAYIVDTEEFANDFPKEFQYFEDLAEDENNYHYSFFGNWMNVCKQIFRTFVSLFKKPFVPDTSVLPKTEIVIYF